MHNPKSRQRERERKRKKSIDEFAARSAMSALRLHVKRCALVDSKNIAYQAGQRVYAFLSTIAARVCTIVCFCFRLYFISIAQNRMACRTYVKFLMHKYANRKMSNGTLYSSAHRHMHIETISTYFRVAVTSASSSLATKFR